MSEVAATPVTASPAVEKKAKKVAGPKKPKVKPNHPPTSEMVDAAIKALNERGGSSFLAVKKYITSTYKADAEKLAPFIKKYLKGSVVKGHLIQTKGKGASGSFKLSSKGSGKAASVAKPKPAKAAAPAKKPATKKVAKKASAAKPKASPKKSVEKKKAGKAKAVAAKKSGTVKAKPKASAPIKVKKPVAKKVSPKKTVKKVSAKK